MPTDVSPEVLERVLGIAVDLSVEGREGRPVGALFVLGDTDVVKNFVNPSSSIPFKVTKMRIEIYSIPSWMRQ